MPSRCRHGLLSGQCTQCNREARGDSNRFVFLTRSGNVYHSLATCEWLAKGHEFASQLGYDTHAVERVPMTDLRIAFRRPCLSCRPSEWSGPGA